MCLLSTDIRSFVFNCTCQMQSALFSIYSCTICLPNGGQVRRCHFEFPSITHSSVVVKLAMICNTAYCTISEHCQITCPPNRSSVGKQGSAVHFSISVATEKVSKTPVFVDDNRFVGGACLRNTIADDSSFPLYRRRSK